MPIVHAINVCDVPEWNETYAESAQWAARMRHADSMLTALSDEEIEAGLEPCAPNYPRSAEWSSRCSCSAIPLEAMFSPGASDRRSAAERLLERASRQPYGTVRERSSHTCRGYACLVATQVATRRSSRCCRGPSTKKTQLCGPHRACMKPT